MKVLVTPTKTLRYAHPGGPHLPQFAGFAGKQQPVDAAFVPRIKKHDPDATIEELAIETPKVKKLETSEDKNPIETSEVEVESTAPSQTATKKRPAKSKKAKPKLMKSK